MGGRRASFPLQIFFMALLWSLLERIATVFWRWGITTAEFNCAWLLTVILSSSSVCLSHRPGLAFSSWGTWSCSIGVRICAGSSQQAASDDGRWENSKNVVLFQEKRAQIKAVSLHWKKKKFKKIWNLITFASNSVSATMHVTVRVTFWHQCCFFPTSSKNIQTFSRELCSTCLLQFWKYFTQQRHTWSLKTTSKI